MGTGAVSGYVTQETKRGFLLLLDDSDFGRCGDVLADWERCGVALGPETDPDADPGPACTPFAAPFALLADVVDDRVALGVGVRGFCGERRVVRVPSVDSGGDGPFAEVPVSVVTSTILSDCPALDSEVSSYGGGLFLCRGRGVGEVEVEKGGS